MKRQKLTWFSLRFPRELEENAVTSALAGFSGLPHNVRILFDISADNKQISHRLAVTSEASDSVTAGLRATIPSLRAMKTETTNQAYTRRLLWQLTPFTAAIRSDDLSATSASLLSSLYPLGAKESVRLIWTARSAVRPRLDTSPESRNQGRTLALRRKLALAGLDVHGELFVQADTGSRANQLMRRIGSTLRSLSTPYGHLVADPYWYGQIAHLLYLRGRFLGVTEIAAVIGWPIGTLDLPGLELGASKRLVPSLALPSRGRILGESNAAGLSRPVAITPSASTRGFYILGPTGTGKTSLIKNLVKADLEQGRGLAVVETNGDLVNDLCDLIPENRINDVVLLDPLDKTHAVGFNPFASPADPSLIADQLIELFQRLWQQFWGPRTAQLAHMALLTLARQKNATLLDLPRLYLDPAFRHSVIQNLDDPLGLELDWRWYESLAEREQSTIIAPLLNKVRSFTARPAIRAILGQANPPLSMRRLMSEQKILLVYIPKGLIGAETAQLLGSLILTAIWQAATERASLSLNKRKYFGLYADEVQDFAHAPIAWDEMLAQGRKYGLALTAAHQNLEQIPRELREVILANARSKAVFALSSSDAKVMEKLFAPSLTAADLQALDAYSIAAAVALDDGSTSRPVTLQTPAPPKSTDSAKQVREASRRNYARRRSEVEQAFRSTSSPRPTTPIGRKPRVAS